MPALPDGKGQDYLQPLNMGLLGDSSPPSNKGPTNESGVGQGGGNPASSPKPTKPAKVTK